jgi:hypothetical protein
LVETASGRIDEFFSQCEYVALCYKTGSGDRFSLSRGAQGFKSPDEVGSKPNYIPMGRESWLIPQVKCTNYILMIQKIYLIDSQSSRGFSHSGLLKVSVDDQVG